MVIGHESQRNDLQERAFAGGRVILLRGLPGIGKWLCAEALAEAHGGATVSLRGNPTTEEVRGLVRFAERFPTHGSAVALVDLDGLSFRSMGILLKTLEAVPFWLEIILVAGKPVISVISSRVHETITFDPLSNYEVALVLEQLGIPRFAAHDLSKLSGGRVDVALMFKEAEAEKPMVMSLLDSVVRHDYRTLSLVAARWSLLTAQIAERWYLEAGAFSVTGVMEPGFFFDEDELLMFERIGHRQSQHLIRAIREGFGPESAARNTWKL